MESLIHLLSVGPVESRGTKELPSSIMEPPSIVFDISGQRWGQCATFGGDPVDDSAFEPFGIVCAGTGCPFLHLVLYSVGRHTK